MSAPLFVIGLGPGGADLLTPKAAKALKCSTCIVGYDLYLNLLADSFKIGKEIIGSGMRHEYERCNLAIDKALAGCATALVSSGDPGIYAMAAPVLELLEKRKLTTKVALEVVAGVPAFCAAAALLGAPIGNDFAAVSLSDLLTPKIVIHKRLQAVLAADLVCILYNPRSRGRADGLREALEIATRYRSPDCPIGLVRNAARPGETTRITSLGQFAADSVDMLSLVIIGNTETRQIGPYLLTPRGYKSKYG